jgi:hypothetical protein
VVKYGEFSDPMMGHRIAYSASSQINRKESGLSFNMMLDGKFVVSDEIQTMIEGELVEQQPAEAKDRLTQGPDPHRPCDANALLRATTRRARRPDTHPTRRRRIISRHQLLAHNAAAPRAR